VTIKTIGPMHVSQFKPSFFFLLPERNEKGGETALLDSTTLTKIDKGRILTHAHFPLEIIEIPRCTLVDVGQPVLPGSKHTPGPPSPSTSGRHSSAVKLNCTILH
jgi:hypothetical protein